MSITGSSATGNVVAGNLIGTNLAGVALGNGEGIIIDGGASSNTIGGSSAATANVIEFNGTGILISDPTTADNLVAANFIGTNSAGATTTGDAIGISIADGASGNSVGGIGVGQHHRRQHLGGGVDRRDDRVAGRPATSSPAISSASTLWGPIWATARASSHRRCVR